MGKGTVGDVAAALAWLFLVIMIFGVLLHSCSQAIDPPEAVEVTVTRTQCAVDTYTDAATNCAYLRSTCGGLTPRLSPSGSPLCRPLNPGAL